MSRFEQTFTGYDRTLERARFTAKLKNSSILDSIPNLLGRDFLANSMTTLSLFCLIVQRNVVFLTYPFGPHPDIPESGGSLFSLLSDPSENLGAMRGVRQH